MRRKHADQLARIEKLLEGVAGASEQIADALNPATPGGLAAVAAEAKGARSSAEAAFAGVQTLASIAAKKPDPAEPGRTIGQQLAAGLASQLAALTTSIREMHEMITAATKPAVSTPAPPKPAKGTAR